VAQQETFKAATMFMSPAQAAAANAAHQIDPTDWISHLNDAGPKLAAFNTELGQARDLSTSFLQSFNNDLINGTVNMNTLTSAVHGLESKLLEMAENQAINSLFKGLSGGAQSGGFNLFNLFGSARAPGISAATQSTLDATLPEAFSLRS